MSAENRTDKRTGILYETGRLLAKIAVIVIGVVMLFTFLFGVFQSSDGSMDPAIKEGDLVFFYRLDKQYVPSDTVVVEYKDKKQVRRVLAVAGDTVDITEDGLIINGQPQMEIKIYEDTNQFVGGVTFPLTVGEGEVFVLGDAREQAVDSRMYGCLAVENTLGQVMTVVRRRGI